MAPRKLPFNQYRLLDDHAILYLDKRNGETFECLVDLPDFERLKELGWHWTASWNTNANGYYATHGEYQVGAGSVKTHLMHKFLMGTTASEQVDHLNHNKLDNRRSNLRVASRSENGRNRIGANRNSQSGIRNVTRSHRRWIVQLYVNGRVREVGHAATPEEAGALASELRQVYYS